MSFICYECHKLDGCAWPYHLPPKAHIVLSADENGNPIEVYGPGGGGSGVSFGRCQDCKKDRPCVNC